MHLAGFEIGSSDVLIKNRGAIYLDFDGVLVVRNQPEDAELGRVHVVRLRYEKLRILFFVMGYRDLRFRIHQGRRGDTSPNLCRSLRLVQVKNRLELIAVLLRLDRLAQIASPLQLHDH